MVVGSAFEEDKPETLTYNWVFFSSLYIGYV